MNSASFFYNIFLKQELILKLNTLDLKKQFGFKKCIVFQPKITSSDDKELQDVSKDLRYILEFLTNTKISKCTNIKYLFKVTLNENKAYALFLYFSYLVFARSNYILESDLFEYDYPVLQKPNLVKNLVGKKYKNYFDIRLRNGLNLPFLSDNEYVSCLLADFYIRFIFKRKLKYDFFFEFKQFLFASMAGLKFILIKKYEDK